MKKFVIMLLALSVCLPLAGLAQPYHTIYEIQQVAQGDDRSYMYGDTVITSGVVTAGAGLFYAGSHISFYLQDNRGGPWSGILVYNADNSAFATMIGDSVMITGLVSEYSTFAGDSSHMTELVTIGEVTTLLPGRPLPAIQIITPGLIDSTNGADSLAEPYEGCLVQVRDVFVSDISSPYRQFNVTDNITGECIIRMYSDSLISYGDPALGTPYESITGVIYSVYGNYTLMPRFSADLVLAEGPPIITGTYWSPQGHPWPDDTVSVYTNLTDNTGIEESSLYYRVNGGSWTDVILAPQGEITYKAMIPPQPDYAQVDFYIYAMDDEANISYDPPDAPAGFYTYTVSDSMPMSIYEVQYTADPLGASFFNYREVQLTGIITADSSDFPVDTTAIYQVLYMQDTSDPYSTGGVWNGVYIYNRNDDGAWIDAVRGDAVALTAIVNEYYGLTELTEITAAAVISSGNPLPQPVQVTCADLAAGTASGEQYEGCLVRLNNVTVTNPAVSPTLWSVTDGSGGECLIGTSGVYDLIPAAGMQISYITGVVRYSSDTFKLEPRDNSDLGQTGVEGFPQYSPYEFALKGIYPNPFNPDATISFSLKTEAKVKLEVFDVLGRSVRTLVDGQMTQGNHSVQWKGADKSGRSASSGIYFIKYSGDGFSFTQKAVMVK